MLQELADRCYQELLSIMPAEQVQESQLSTALAHELALLDRGVRYRLLYAREQLESRAMRQHMRTLRRHGAEVRIADTLQHRLVVFDRVVSFLPVDPRKPRSARWWSGSRRSSPTW